VHVRPVEQLLGLIAARDARPLGVAREPAGRIAGNCRHFSVLMVTMLRFQGVPARARCGFGGYFGTGIFEDHWVCEYWNKSSQRWMLVDAQVDARQRELFPIDFDLTDVPRDRFLIAGDAWIKCREGTEDLELFDLLAAYTRLADGAFDLLRQLCADDDRLAVPPAVTNELRGREEPR
jgi:hypothetical protein